MSSIIHCAAIALNQTALDWKGNQIRLLNALSEAKSAGAQVICTPELSITGYGCEDAFMSENTMYEAFEVLKAILPYTNNTLSIFGCPVWLHGQCYNAMAVCCDGRLMGFIPKQHLAGDGVHYEPRWFAAWPKGQVDVISVFDHSVPIGDLLFEVNGIRFGIEICRDAWVEDRTGIDLVKRGAHVILNPTASHFAFGKIDKREAIAVESIEQLDVAYVYANASGNDAGKILFDGDTRIATAEVYYQGPRLRMGSVQVLEAAIDISAFLAKRPLVEYHDEHVVVGDFEWQSTVVTDPKSCPDSWQIESPDRKEEEFSRAVAMGLLDYMRKSRSHGFVLNLSGGADSAACATLVKLMLFFAEQHYGIEGLHERLSYIPNITQCTTLDALTRRLLCCIYQQTNYNSDSTMFAAQQTASGLGATFYHWNIQNLVENYGSIVETAIDESLEWDKHDLALQNVQARVRGPSAWLVANLRNAILLATGNRSEAAVGYTTMDGDTCGGLSPIGGVDKAFVLHWLKWMETTAPEGIEPMPFLSAVNNLQPSAELKPSVQRDEEELMPYTLMSAIEELAIGQKQSPIQIYEVLRSNEEIEIPKTQLKAYVARFFKLWSRNQWKRERYAPAFHLDEKSLDPKSWFRFPILSGSYAKELALLDEQD
jgi:NAD+ synthase (glutamine-hydrolysing)